ncbi:transglycosylase SLT domain-containing protein [Lishizhenia sp.]|uniref:transglycosylase SLT domain-containing protein n=1 Tax=Lishizhenia sp. TaxID=2497594 RepID=UPI00299DEF65|nr:transglycosylase SLT domain-containing protein [Lishizhenia sp.]MDX1445794.1 transglycosylase SLT domain-containing protein [Lishizhenia sp.]
MKTLLTILAIFPFLSFAIERDTTVQHHWKEELRSFQPTFDTNELTIISTNKIFEECWDELAHPNFWKTIMRLSPDSCVINIAATRTIVQKMAIADWDKNTDDEKDAIRDSIRAAHGLDAEDKIYMTTGKNDFYQFEKVIPSLAKGVEVFHEEGVDPWYAQAILLIESPGKLAKSNVGAYGAFQLMKGVARSHGLRVDKYVDERKDFKKSAQAAASLLSNTCIPHARRILDEHDLHYNENDLWFRLFVLHIYHAGAGNVEAVVNVIDPEFGGMNIIQEMWVNSAAHFKNSSQNYSQLALASLMILDEIVHNSSTLASLDK